MTWKELYKSDINRGVKLADIFIPFEESKRIKANSFTPCKQANATYIFKNLWIGNKLQDTNRQGFYIGHPYCITINPKAVIGDNCNIHKGMVIGLENRGERRGSPIIGNSVWIGINSAIVGKIYIGDDELIAPCSYVNCDVPSHSVVFGNPCIIKHKDNATSHYVNRKV